MPERVRADADLTRFEDAFEAHHRAVLAYALRRTRSEADAEDATAETFAIAWRRWESVPADALPWLYGVARRVLANQHRGGLRRSSLLERLRLHRPPPSAEIMAGGPATAALATLRPDDQELLRLVAWEDLGHAEIAVVLGITPNAVAIRLHRARKRYLEALRTMAGEVKGFASDRTSASVTGRDVVIWRHEET